MPLPTAEEYFSQTQRPDADPRPAPTIEQAARGRGRLSAEDAWQRLSSWLNPRERRVALLLVLLPVLTLGGGLGLWYGYTQQKFFVGHNDTTVAVFQGIHETVLTLPLSHVVQADTTRLDDLPPYYKELVLKTWEVPSLEQGQVVLAELRKKAEECIAQRAARAQATATPSPTRASPIPTPNPATAPTASPTQTGTDTPPAMTEC